MKCNSLIKGRTVARKIAPNMLFFPFPELMEVGDIEKFFNENFFKKISHHGRGDRVESRGTGVRDPTTANNDFVSGRKEEFLHGVPESAYEPTSFKNNVRAQFQ